MLCQRRDVAKRGPRVPEKLSCDKSCMLSQKTTLELIFWWILERRRHCLEIQLDYVLYLLECKSVIDKKLNGNLCTSIRWQLYHCLTKLF